MTIWSILAIIVIILLLYIFIRYVLRDLTILTTLSSGTVIQQIKAADLSTTNNPNSSNFSYSLWFYVSDWNYKYGENKILFGRMGSLVDSSQQGSSIQKISSGDPCPVVLLGDVENNLTILLSVYPGTGSNLSVDDIQNPSGSVVHSCTVSNVPIQKWVNVIISTYGRTLDVYIDGKLIKTSVLPGIPKINKDADVFLTPAGGFSGVTSKLQYFPNPTDPQTAWSIYQAGYGQSWLSGLFGNYQIKVSLEENGTETRSFTI